MNPYEPPSQPPSEIASRPPDTQSGPSLGAFIIVFIVASLTAIKFPEHVWLSSFAVLMAGGVTFESAYRLIRRRK